VKEGSEFEDFFLKFPWQATILHRLESEMVQAVVMRNQKGPA
jgi:hypothetical protein